MNIPGYNPSHIVNPYVFADLSQPQRRRNGVSPVVFQTGPPTIRDPYLDAVAEALHGDAPTGGGAYVGGHLRPGSQLLGSYEAKGSKRRGGLRRGASLVATFSSEGVNLSGALNALQVLAAGLKQGGLYQLEHIGWGPGHRSNLAIARIVVRMNGTSPGALHRELVEAAQYATMRLGGGSFLLADLDQASSDSMLGTTTPQQQAQDVGDQLVQALFSERPEDLVIQAPVRRLTWYERTYLGVPVWALAGLGVFVAGTAGWAWKRRKPRGRR